MPRQVEFTPDYIKNYGWDKYTFSASTIGMIMTDPKGKSNMQKYNEAVESLKKAEEDRANCSAKAIKTAEKLDIKIIDLREKIPALYKVKDEVNLSDTCKKFLCDIYTQVMFGRWEDIQSKYLEKGLAAEEDAITLYSLVTNQMYSKNKVRKFNDWTEGECDFEDGDIVFDTKVNWSIFQFNRTIATGIKPLYHWQLDTYMDLFDKKEAKLIYALINTPQELLAMEEKKLRQFFVASSQELYDWELDQAISELRHLHTYDDIAPKDKIRVFEVKRDDSRIERIHKRVEECRKFLNELTSNKTIIINQIEDDEQQEMAA